MRLDRATVCLPTADRAASHAFYTALGFVATGELGDNGLPEPLQFEISSGLRVMLIPTDGFGWVIGDRELSSRGTHECLIVIGLGTRSEVDDMMRRARAADAEIVQPAGDQTWGEPAAGNAEVGAYAGAFADPDGHLWHVSLADGVLIR
jgi:predicted lactoylglutathione lyase